ncbi:hypothetical protein CYMTET_13765 [Cymbomonas tetramitiformis]|uniref:Uncharacterized protein n=1 Tax=Cymbomonas tetramitiformis TaxID=36881 RepID=A0AAE0GHY6_9CHLO|nr:hypothetical protein CYMTET_13765 [Cymbomonas tetramitiformis]
MATPSHAAIRAARQRASGDSETSPTNGGRPRGATRRIVTTSSLRTRPTCVGPSATAAEFHRDPAVWVSTPVEEGREDEYSDKMTYAFTYAEDVLTLLHAHEFKKNVGITLDTSDAETDFAILLSSIHHVLGPISHYEFDMLLDLDNEYEAYHMVLNELIFTILPVFLRGSALRLYNESAKVHPGDGRCALQRLRFFVEGIPDPDTERFWTRLRAVIIDEKKDPAPQLEVISKLMDKQGLAGLNHSEKWLRDFGWIIWWVYLI